MIKLAKTGIVVGLETLCSITGHRWCNRLAGLSAKLDERWSLGEWKTAIDESDVGANE